MMSDRAASIDLNADLGEDPAALESGREHALLDHITSANIACGGHAGDPRTMRAVAALAIERGVAIGAHPSYPDRRGFGRIAITITPDALRASLQQQIASLIDAAAEIDGRVVHVKPHGALYHAASIDPEIANAILEAAHACDPTLTLIAPSGSPALAQWRAAGARVIAEAFADRRYLPDRSLAPRTEPGAVIDDEGQAVGQGVQLARHQRIAMPDGSFIALSCQTICIHSDTPNAPHIARSLHAALVHAGIRVEPARVGT